VTPAGELVAAGAFGAARWTGSVWIMMPTGSLNGLSIVRSLVDGTIVASGSFGPWIPGQNDKFIARWNGTAWVMLGQVSYGDVVSLLPLPGGGMLASGTFTLSNSNLKNFLRWDGLSWAAVPDTQEAVNDFAWMPNGDLIACGQFTEIGGQYSPRLARLSATCPALSLPAGAGCVGSGGINLLATSQLPWLGGTFRAVGTGLPMTALVSRVFGFQPINLPLAALLPTALPGCDLLVSPDFVDFAVTTTGTTSSTLSIPATPSLVGASFRHQLNLFEVDASLNFVEVTASNALALTIGVF
jgi:hypothetical protein